MSSVCLLCDADKVLQEIWTTKLEKNNVNFLALACKTINSIYSREILVSVEFHQV
jgi:hypothetical protein